LEAIGLKSVKYMILLMLVPVVTLLVCWLIWTGAIQF